MGKVKNVWNVPPRIIRSVCATYSTKDERVTYAIFTDTGCFTTSFSKRFLNETEYIFKNGIFGSAYFAGMASGHTLLKFNRFGSGEMVRIRSLGLTLMTHTAPFHENEMDITPNIGFLGEGKEAFRKLFRLPVYDNYVLVAGTTSAGTSSKDCDPIGILEIIDYCAETERNALLGGSIKVLSQGRVGKRGSAQVKRFFSDKRYRENARDKVEEIRREEAETRLVARSPSFAEVMRKILQGRETEEKNKV